VHAQVDTHRWTPLDGYPEVDPRRTPPGGHLQVDTARWTSPGGHLQVDTSRWTPQVDTPRWTNPGGHQVDTYRWSPSSGHLLADTPRWTPPGGHRQMDSSRWTPQAETPGGHPQCGHTQVDTWITHNLLQYNHTHILYCSHYVRAAWNKLCESRGAGICMGPSLIPQIISGCDRYIYLLWVMSGRVNFAPQNLPSQNKNVFLRASAALSTPQTNRCSICACLIHPSFTCALRIDTF
jgi:hypothetical protein